MRSGKWIGAGLLGFTATAVATPASEDVRPLGDFHAAFRAPRDTIAPVRSALGIVTIAGERESEEAVRGAALAVAFANEDRTTDDAPFTLEIAEAAGRWGTAAEAGRDLRYDRDCLGLISPSDRAIAHLLAQIAIRGRVPVMTLATESSVTRIPDPWVFRVAPAEQGPFHPTLDGRREPVSRFVGEYRRLHGEDPPTTAAEAFDAAAVMIAAARSAGPDRSAMRDWMASTTSLETVTGFTHFDGSGNAAGARTLTSTEPREHRE